jgi:hypothetical protein
MIVHVLQRPSFQTTPQGRQLIDDLALTAQVEAALIQDFPKVTAEARNGEVVVNIRASLVDEKSISFKVKQIVEKIDGVRKILINIVPHIIQT